MNLVLKGVLSAILKITVLLTQVSKMLNKHVNMMCVISKTTRQYMINWKAFNKRILTAKLLENQHLNCFGPTDIANYADNGEFYLFLSSIMRRIPMSDVGILMLDFNVRIRKNY